MAINFEELKKKKESKILSEAELYTIKMIEKEIDDILQEYFDEGEILVEINNIEYITYESNPEGEARTGLTTTCRGLVMYDRIIEDYVNAGWSYREGTIGKTPYIICFKGTNDKRLNVNEL